MKVICAPDSFKESLTATQAARVMADAVRRASPTAGVEACPISDGGEGFATVIAGGDPPTLTTSTVTGPLSEPVQACWYLLETGDPLDAAVIEMARRPGCNRCP